MKRNPVPSSPAVSARMSRQPTKGTKPELDLASELRSRRFRVLLNVTDLPGRPDVVLPNRGIAVFVNGCFWHGCPTHGRLPKSNQEWWRQKIENNKRRDKRKVRQLRSAGWRVFTVWEHTPAVRAAARITQAARKSGRRSVR